MAVSGTMALSKATLVAGSVNITVQRGTDTWGANYAFNPNGLQNDIKVIADALSGLYNGFTPLSSGSYTLGTLNVPLQASGIVMNNNAGVPMKLIITAGGLVSGVVA